MAEVKIQNVGDENEYAGFLFHWIQFSKDEIDSDDVFRTVHIETHISTCSLGSGEQTTDGRTMFAAGPPGNCCLSNNSHFQQTPIPIFHLVFKIAAESLVPALTCRGPRAKTGKGRSSTLLTQPVSSD